MQSDEIVLYWNIASPYSRAIKALFDISGVSYTSKEVDLFNNEQKKPEYLKINPLGLVPAITVNGKTNISQSIAILFYLCQKYPEKVKGYYGNTPEQKAKIISIFSWVQFSFSLGVGREWVTRRDYGFRMKKPVPQRILVASEKGRQRSLKRLDEMIQGREYILGENPTIADLLIYFLITMEVYIGKNHKGFKNVERWFEKMGQIKEIKKINERWEPIGQQIQEVLAKFPVDRIKPSL